MTAIWAHRGASAYAPENTLPAFALAEEMGAEGIELDAQLTADGEIVVIHDETLDRTTNGTGAVAERTLAELRALDASFGMAGFRGTGVPSLAEVLELVKPGHMVVNVELKTSVEFYPGIEKVALDVIAASGLGERVIVSSFNHYTLKTVQQIAPATRVGLLFVEQLYLPWEYAVEFGAVAIHPHHGFLQIPGVVEYAAAAGIDVNTWTVNSEEDLARMIALRPAAVITNHPDRALRIRG
ncbi:MAG: glycerophosphodiester phosphodiesterase [Propionibacteriaceae bacterium]|nr:glycerophosphodiester phosphodiesterase [Propionibacteriaceae bacterium]